MKDKLRDIEMRSAERRNADAEIRRLQDIVRRQQVQLNLSEERERSYKESLASTEERLCKALDEMKSMMSSFVDYMTGKGAVSLSDNIRDAVVQGLKEQHAAEMAALKADYDARISAYERRIEEMGGMLDSEKKALEADLSSKEHQRNNFQEALFGQSTESSLFHGRNVVDADTADLEGTDVEESTFDADVDAVRSVALKVKRHYSGNGKKKPRRIHPAFEEAEERILRPKDMPADVEYVGDDVSYRVSYVSGYVRTTKIVRPKYRDKDGNYYQVKVLHKNTLGKAQVDESVLAMILHKHFIEHVTLSEIEKNLRLMGLNYAHGTVMGWIDAAADIFRELDSTIQTEIQSDENQHSDETTLDVCDVPLPRDDKSGKKSGDNDDLEGDCSPGEDVDETGSNARHYFTRWLFAHVSPKYNLVQYKFFEGGRRNREAIQDYMKDIDHKIWLHSDGAPLYKCYDVGDLVIRVACAVHMRRPFWKLRQTYEEANYITNLFNSIFSLEDGIKERTDDMEERRSQRVLYIDPVLLEIKQHLDMLEKSLVKESDPELLKAVKYAQKEWPSLLHCLTDASLEWSNNLCERQVRCIAAYRNASFYVGSRRCAENFATIMSYAQSCRMNKVNFEEWTGDVIRRIVEKKYDDLRDLLPNRWQKTTENVNLNEFYKSLGY